jgi:hypothetical protein
MTHRSPLLSKPDCHSQWLHRLVLVCGLNMCGAVWGQDQVEIYRCGNAYTNQPETLTDCARIGPAPVTVIEGTRVHTAPTTTSPAKAAGNPRAAPLADASPNEKVDALAQKERDQQARQILESELTKAMASQAEMARLWNNGEPIKQGDEFKNQAKYQQRITELRMGLLRAESDIAGLRRELARLSTMVVKP